MGGCERCVGSAGERGEVIRDDSRGWRWLHRRKGGGVGDRGSEFKAGLMKFQHAGATVGVAWDAVAGALLVTVDGEALNPVFTDGVAPGPVVGVGLFPALSGSDGCRVGWNLGRRPFRHPPPPGFLPCASTAPEQVTARGFICVGGATAPLL